MRAIGGGVVAVFLLCAGVAAAQKKQVSAEVEAQALAHYEAAKRAFRLNELDKAIAEWKAGYELNADPTALFNIGMAYRDKQERQTALRFFKSFKKENTDPAAGERADRMIAELEQAIAQDRPAAPALPPSELPSVEPEPPPAATVTATRPQRRFHATVALGAGLPQSSYDFMATGPTVRVGVAYDVVRTLAVHAGFRWIWAGDGTDDGQSDSQRYYEIALGARYGIAITPRVSLGAELELVRAHHSDTLGGSSYTSDGWGAGGRVGFNVAITEWAGVGASFGYSMVWLSGALDEFGDDDGSWAWLDTSFTASF